MIWEGIPHSSTWTLWVREHLRPFCQRCQSRRESVVVLETPSMPGPEINQGEGGWELLKQCHYTIINLYSEKT